MHTAMATAKEARYRTSVHVHWVQIQVLIAPYMISAYGYKAK